VAHGTRALETRPHHPLGNPIGPMDRGGIPSRDKQRGVRRRIIRRLPSSHAVKPARTRPRIHHICRLAGSDEEITKAQDKKPRGPLSGGVSIARRGNKLRLQWVASHAEFEGNEVAERMAKEATAGELYGDSESRRFQSRTSMSYLKRRATEAKTRGTKEWIAERTKRRRSYIPPKKTGFRKERERKAIASRHHQPPTGHALIAPFLKEELKKTDSDQCWWCETGKRQTRDHLFKECGRWKTETNVLWTTICKKLGWKHRRNKTSELFREKATGAILQFLRDMESENQEWSIKTIRTRL